MFLEMLSVMLMIDSPSLFNIVGYIDPGSGSLIIQIIIGALVGVGITMKIYWFKFKAMFSGIIKKDA